MNRLTTLGAAAVSVFPPDVAEAQELMLHETIATYDQTAPEYAARFRGTLLRSDMDRFLTMLPMVHGRVLDAGCGPARDCAAFERLGVDVVGLDLSAGLLREAQEATLAPLVRGDLRRTPFQGECFDGVWACASLVHLDKRDLTSALEEFARVLRPRGALYVTLRAGGGEEWRSDGPNLRRHFYLYDEGTLGGALKETGFEICGLATEPGVVGGTWVNAFARRAGGAV